jgi:putative membrane protein
MNTAQPNLCLGAMAGALGGIVGSWTMVLFNHMVGGIEENRRREPYRRERASPNNQDGTISDEPASLKLARKTAEPVLGRALTESEKEAGGDLFHYGFGALAGAIYGAAAEVRPRTTAGAGAPFGAAVWLAADEVGLPLVGLAKRPTEYPPSRHAAALGTHLVFGVTVEGVRRLLRGRHANTPDLASTYPGPT